METNKSSWRKTFTKFFFIAILLFITGLVAYFYVPYSNSGVRAGQLNYILNKGVIFKTYEGKLIQTGIKSGNLGVESNAFEFSIKDKKTYDALSKCAGKYITVHYKEYYGAIPWRGYTKFIVDSIISVENVDAGGVVIDPNIFQGQE